MISIIISSHNRIELFRRTLWSISNFRPKNHEVELVVVDDDSTDDILSEIRYFSSRFYWKFIKFDYKVFEQETGLKKFWNNPSVTNNIGFKNCNKDSEIIFQQGNEVIALKDTYDTLIQDIPKDVKYWSVMSTTYDMPKNLVGLLDKYGSIIRNEYVNECKKFPLQSHEYQSDVTNYISCSNRELWEKIEGYNEQYFGGISAEDSDFVRRARATGEYKRVISEGVSLHQYHGGKTKYYNPSIKNIELSRFEEGCSINRTIYDNWDNNYKNPQKWDFGTIGIKEIITK